MAGASSVSPFGNLFSLREVTFPALSALLIAATIWLVRRRAA